MKNTKRFTKVVSTIVAVCTITCATTVNSSAFCLNDIFGCGTNGQNGNCGNSIVQIINCLRSGKCNIFDLFSNKTDCTNGDCGDTTGNDCVGDNCNQTPTQTEVIKPTTPTTPTTPTASTVTTTNSNVKAVFDLVNKERKAAGLGAVTLSEELCKTADIRAKEIVKSFSHTRPNGTSCFTAFKENGITYRYAGENIAYGQKTATEVMNGWMNSAGHRANILGKNFGKIGISCYEYGGRKYWVQLFIN